MANNFYKPLQIIFDGVTDGIHSITESLTRKDPHSASFGKASEIGSIFESGVQIGKHVKISKSESYQNTVIFGVPGSGKTTRFIIPNIYEAKNASYCINDPSGDIYAATSGILSKRCDLKVLNYSSSRESSAYNPVARIRIMGDLYRLADALVRLTIDKNSTDPFWGLQARQILVTLLILLFYFPAKYRNLLNLNQLVKLLCSDPEKIDRWIIHTSDNQLITDYKSIISLSDRTLQSCLASVKSVLSFVEDPQIARVTSFDTLNIQNIRRRPTALFLRNSIGSLKYVSILNGLFFEQFFSGLLNKMPQQSDLVLYNILDEASSLYINNLAAFLANNRKYNIINILAIQTQHQLTSLYKDEAQDILSCCVSKIYLPGITEMSVLRDLEALSGKTTFTDKKGNKTVRSLITAPEIMSLGKDEALILSGRNRLIKTRTLPYYKNLKYKEFIKMRPLQFRTDIPRYTMPLLH